MPLVLSGYSPACVVRRNRDGNMGCIKQLIRFLSFPFLLGDAMRSGYLIRYLHTLAVLGLSIDIRENAPKDLIPRYLIRV